MLAERHGLKSIWRRPGKTLLFFILLAILTAVLALGLCIYSAIFGHLADCDDYYRTIAVLEYIGQDYNDETVYDAALSETLASDELELDALTALPGIKCWEPFRSALGVAGDFTWSGVRSTGRNSAVLLVSNLFWEGQSASYQGIIQACLYSNRDVTGKTVFISRDGLDSALDLDETRTYVFTGRFISGANSYLWFLPEQIDGSGEPLPVCKPVPDGLAEDDPYRAAAMAVHRRANGLRVVMTGGLEALYPFQQQELQITKGRAFTSAEYAGERVCVLPEKLAEALGVGVGDTFDLSLYYSVGDGIYSTHQLGGSPDYSDVYQVVGLCTSSEDYGDWIFVPDSADYQADSCPTGYTLGQFCLDNAQAAAFYDQARDLLPAGFRLTLYDQGYAATVAPFRELLRIAQVFLAVCALVILAVLSLFGYLFVFRRRETAQTMVALGAGKAHVHRYFASGSLSILVPASALGVLLSNSLERAVLRYVAEFAAQYQADDLRYSSAALTIMKTLDFRPNPPAWLFVLAAVLMTAATLAVGALFAARAIAPRRQKTRHVRSPRSGGHTTHISGFLQYPLLSIRRGGVRTSAVLALTLLVSLFLGQLAATEDVYRERLQQVEASTVIRGYATDSKGLTMDGLTLRNQQLQALYETGLLETLDITSGGTYYRIEGIARDASGETQYIPPTSLPASNFALETLGAQMSREPSVISTTSLTNSPEFYYGADPGIVWLEGYDESCLRGRDASICLLPQSVMEREKIALGDVIQVFLCTPAAYTVQGQSVLLTVVGSYLPQGTAEALYLPLGYWFPLGTEEGTTVPREGLLLQDLDDYHYRDLRLHFVDPNAETSDPFLDFLRSRFSYQVTFQNYESAWLAFFRSNGSACVIRKSLRAELGLEFGDTLTLTSSDGKTLDYTLLGEFEDTPILQEDLYCSCLPIAGELTSYFDEAILRENLQYYTCGSAIFTLRSTEDLPAVRDALEELDFSMVRSTSGSRTYLVLDDKDFTSTVSSMQRQIRYMDTLYRCLYVLCGVIGLVVSWLLLAARRQELAIMRGLGTQSVRIFGSFFLEQLFLSCLGCGLGIGLWLLSGQPLIRLQLLLTAVFLGCWSTGTLSSLIHQMCSGALAALADRE